MDGDRTAGAWETRGGRWERRGRGAGVPRRRELGEIEKILQHFVMFCNRNGAKRREPLRKGAESESKSYGKREKKIQEAGVSDPPVPPHNTYFLSENIS